MSTIKQIFQQTAICRSQSTKNGLIDSTLHITPHWAMRWINRPDCLAFVDPQLHTAIAANPNAAPISAYCSKMAAKRRSGSSPR